MKETELSINQIESAIVGRVDSPFYIRRNIVIPNVSWGFLNHEADLLVISQQGMLTEIEIKRTWADFMADFKKGHNHYDIRLSRLYFAVPYRIAERVFHWLYEGEFADNNGTAYANKPKEQSSYTGTAPAAQGFGSYQAPQEQDPFGPQEDDDLPF